VPERRVEKRVRAELRAPPGPSPDEGDTVDRRNIAIALVLGILMGFISSEAVLALIYTFTATDEEVWWYPVASGVLGFIIASVVVNQAYRRLEKRDE
jgi:hypothetical protein